MRSWEPQGSPGLHATPRLPGPRLCWRPTPVWAQTTRTPNLTFSAFSLEKHTSLSGSCASPGLCLVCLRTPIIYKLISKDGLLLNQLEDGIYCHPLISLNLSFLSKDLLERSVLEEACNTADGIFQRGNLTYTFMPVASCPIHFTCSPSYPSPCKFYSTK